ncbi:MAG: thiamine-phosphate kinase [Verrucomicrobiae bacterium]
MTDEDALLGKILRGLGTRGDLVVGPGDDCAVVRCGRRHLLLKTDCVVEGVHFLRGHDPARVGWKALCRPLSDIAAMGGVPEFALVTIFSPPDIDAGYWENFYRGIRRAARRFGVTVAGGEISRQPSGIAVSVALTGAMDGVRPVLRSGGRPGDWLFVTGKLGGSLAGHHLDFIPRLAEGRWLARHVRPHAMMDLSDGLGSDLPRMARASGCGFHVESLPARCGTHAALTDGEDYELLFAVPEQRARRLLKDWPFPRTPLTRIGELTAPGRVPDGWPAGWDHFSIVRNPPLRQRAGVPPERVRRKKLR